MHFVIDTKQSQRIEAQPRAQGTWPISLGLPQRVGGWKEETDTGGAYGNRSALQLVVAFAAQINRDVRQPRTTKTSRRINAITK